MGKTRLGAHFATPLSFDGPWLDNLRTFQMGEFTAAKIMIPAGFGWKPKHVRELIHAGAREIILRTEDNDYHHHRVRYELVDLGFYQVIRDHPDVEFILEVGNEQNLAMTDGKPAPLDPWLGRYWQLETRHKLLDLDRDNLTWVASLPTDLNQARIYINAKTRESFAGADEIGVADVYDGFGAHIYGHFDLHVGGAEDGPGGATQWWRIIDDIVKNHPDIDIYLTEFGINHVFSDPSTKPDRYLAFLNNLNPDRFPSAYVYWVGSGERHPSYQVDANMALRLRSYNDDPPVDDDPPPPVGNPTIADAVRELQEWAMAQDPTFEPIDFEEDV